jgi:hypothetical protein
MTRRTLPLRTATGLVLACALVALLLWAFAHRPASGPVYTVAQVVNGAIHHPNDWDGRYVRVRAIASVSLLTILQGRTQHTQANPQILLSPIPDARSAAVGLDGMIQVLTGREDGLLSFLRRLPVIGGTMPPPQRVSMTHAATYLLQVHLAARGCNFSPCVAAILVDAAPGADPSAGLPYGM